MYRQSYSVGYRHIAISAPNQNAVTARASAALAARRGHSVIETASPDSGRGGLASPDSGGGVRRVTVPRPPLGASGGANRFRVGAAPPSPLPDRDHRKIRFESHAKPDQVTASARREANTRGREADVAGAA
jgi:hypothetical protein